MQFPIAPIFAKVEVSLVHKNKTTETAGGRDQAYPDKPSKLKIETSFNKGANPDELRAVNAFINRVRGSLTSFTLSVPHISDGTGVETASPTVLSNAASGYQIRLKNLPHGVLIRRAGDLLQHSSTGHVYMLASDLIADSNGFADAEICTPLLAPISANDDVKIDSILIKVKLTKNEFKYGYDSLEIRSMAPLTFIQVL